MILINDFVIIEFILTIITEKQERKSVL